MRHGKKVNHLGRQKGHREALMTNMAISLIMHKKINTTLAKAKALRKFVEPILTKSKTDSTHSRRVAFSYLQNKEALQELFGDVATKIANRPGGYTRILKTGFRVGDSADMCLIELVDYNQNMLGDDTKKKSRRRSKAKSTTSAPKAEAKAAVIEDVQSEAVNEEIIVDNTSVENSSETEVENNSDNKE